MRPARVLGGRELRHRLRPARVGRAHRRDRRGLVPGAVGRTNRLLEALAVDGDHPRGRLDDRRRASVVRREHHAPRGRVVLPEAEDSAHVGEAPRVDRLVVVADHEEVVLRERQAAGRGEAARRPRPGTRRRRRARIATASGGGAPDPSASRSAGADHEVVEVDARRAPAAAPRRSAGRPPHRPAARDPPPSRPRATCRAAKPPGARPMDPPRHVGGGRRAGAGADRRGCSTPRRRRGAPGARERGACGPRSAVASGTDGPRRFATRPARSCAASRLKVTTQIREGWTPRARSTARRATIVVVLPLPAGAMIWAGPSGRIAAARCSGSRACQDRAEVDAGRLSRCWSASVDRVTSSLTDGLAAGYR